VNFLTALVFLAVILAGPIPTAQADDAIFASPTRLRSWSDAPDSITLPAAWVQPASQLTGETTQDHVEHAACLAWGGITEVDGFGKDAVFEHALPACASGNIGTIHTHLAPPAFFSDVDVASFIRDLRRSPGSARIHIVAHQKTAGLFLATDATNRYLASAVGQLIVPHIAGIVFSRSAAGDKVDMIGCLFRAADIAVYSGTLPTLTKVRPRDDFTLGPFTCHTNGVTVEHPRFFNIIAAARTVLHAGEARDRATDLAGGYANRLDAAVAAVARGGDLDFIRAFSNLSVRNDPHVAVTSTDANVYFPVGACEDHDAKSQTIGLYPFCSANVDFRTSLTRCQDTTQDRPIVRWYLDDARGSMMRLTWAEAGDAAHCRVRDFQLRDDGTRGPQIGAGLVNADRPQAGSFRTSPDAPRPF
jgi:hypothetical protein